MSRAAPPERPTEPGTEGEPSQQGLRTRGHSPTAREKLKSANGHVSELGGKSFPPLSLEMTAAWPTSGLLSYETLRGPR